MFPTLDTPRLTLRSFQRSDIEPFSRYRSDPEVARYQGWEIPYTLEQATRFVGEMIAASPGIPGQPYQVAIELRATGEMIGDCMFVRLPEDERQAEIGFTLARAFQGQGYASEAVARLLDYLFSDLNLRRVRANCDPQNTSSARLLRRLGMRQEGHFIESLWLKGCWVDEDWYAILRIEWQKRLTY
ncbi:MAG TPA: GNAT family N-acetyltransferase [Anaerolineaceae bacterium]|nr:GNAT family N-acetyltransferase [Anaerolineaceae bacterium]